MKSTAKPTCNRSLLCTHNKHHHQCPQHPDVQNVVKDMLDAHDAENQDAFIQLYKKYIEPVGFTWCVCDAAINYNNFLHDVTCPEHLFVLKNIARDVLHKV